MMLTVNIDVPPEIEEAFLARGDRLANEMKEAYVVELFRKGELSHFALSKALGLDRFQTDAYLKQNSIFEGSLTHEEVEQDVRTLRDLLAKGGK